MGEALLRARLDARGVPNTVLSAGLVTEGQRASANGVKAMARRGLDISDHRSQKINPPLIGGADLIIGMERQHVREVAVADTAQFGVTFTLPELARRLSLIGPRGADEDVDSYLRRASADRRPADILRDDPSDEVADPIGQSARRYEATAVELEGLLDQVMANLYP